MIDKVIEIESLKKKYKLYANKQDRLKETVSLTHRNYHKDFWALDDISFDVSKGETVGVIGTNGSGKSTLLKIITGVLTPTEGKVSVVGKISALLELGTGFNQEYTGIENIYLNGRMMGYARREMEERVSAIVDFADIGEFINQPVKSYSSGMFARLAFAVAINVEPDILIVDEALSVGDLFFQNKCFKKFDELKEKGVTILFVSHDISSVRQMCSRVLWLDKGKQITFGQSDEVCDLYMDMKRRDMNELRGEIVHQQGIQYLKPAYKSEFMTFPKVLWKNSSIQTEKLQIQSVFILDSHRSMTNILVVDEKYEFHVVIKLNADMDELIVGVVVENNKGIPLYDINNYINSRENIRGSKDEVIEVIFQFTLPRIMKGNYIVSSAVAQGTQEEHIMLTWLHGVQDIEVVNKGYNSSYIEIPANIFHNIYAGDKVEFKYVED